MEFQVGDVVQLNSGGPWMTVRAIADGKVVCGWFNETGGIYTHEKQDFPIKAVKKVH